MTRRIDVDGDWEDLRADWTFREGITYLNHGSFGPSPRPVLAAADHVRRQLVTNPMDFYVREYEAAYFSARARLGEFVGATAENLAFVENATYGMNVIAHGFPLAAGDEVLVTDHEYGAVLRVWQRACDRAGASITTARLPFPFTTVEEVVESVNAAITPRTKLLVVSHITSPTAVILPIADLCRLARERGVRVAIDGPHAVGTVPLSLDELDADYYTASCHKWLCAPFGSGFLHVAPRWHQEIKPPVLSWGRIQPARPERWFDEFVWQGTRDPVPYLAVPAAIDHLASIGWDGYRQRTHWLARYARARFESVTGHEAFVPDDPAWYGSMISIPLNPGDAPALQRELREKHGIEIPVVDWQGRRSIRVSCHLYNSTRDIEKLAESLPLCAAF